MGSDRQRMKKETRDIDEVDYFCLELREELDNIAEGGLDEEGRGAR